MSYFDPHQLYYRSNRKTHKGQIIQKRFVDHDSSFTKEDLDRSFRVLTAYGYYFSRYPPNPLAKTVSLSKQVDFSNDNILDLNELITSSLRTNILNIDSNFFQLDPAEVKHCYFYVGVLLVQDRVTGPTYAVDLHDGTQASFTSIEASNAPCWLTYYSSSQLALYISSYYKVADRETLEDSAAVTYFAVDDIGIYQMLYDNDFSSLISYPLIQITKYGDYHPIAYVQYSIDVVNFD